MVGLRRQILYSFPAIDYHPFFRGVDLTDYVWEYVRAFHKHKPINPVTGKRNPTIMNNSWGHIQGNETTGLGTSRATNYYDKGGVRYTESNPPPNGWEDLSVIDHSWTSCNIRVTSRVDLAIKTKVEDAIKDGVVVVCAAGNDNEPSDKSVTATQVHNYNIPLGTPDRYRSSGGTTKEINTFGTPSEAEGTINVGSLSSFKGFERSGFSNVGSLIDVFAPGSTILGAFNSQGFPDTKYTQGSGNFYYPISGTSMASPQVSGVAALISSMSPGTRFTGKDLLGYLSTHSIYDDMTVDTGMPQEVNYPRIEFHGRVRTDGTVVWTEAKRISWQDYGTIDNMNLDNSRIGWTKWSSRGQYW